MAEHQMFLLFRWGEKFQTDFSIYYLGPTIICIIFRLIVLLHIAGTVNSNCRSKGHQDSLQQLKERLSDLLGELCRNKIYLRNITVNVFPISSSLVLVALPPDKLLVRSMILSFVCCQTPGLIEMILIQKMLLGPIWFWLDQLLGYQVYYW